MALARPKQILRSRKKGNSRICQLSGKRRKATKTKSIIKETMVSTLATRVLESGSMIFGKYILRIRSCRRLMADDAVAAICEKRFQAIMPVNAKRI